MQKRITLFLFSLCIVTSQVFATNSIPVLPINFVDSFSCHDYFEQLSTDPDSSEGVDSWARNFANLADYTPYTVDKNCNNGQCTWTFKFYLTPNGHPAGGGCVLANTVFWPSAQAEIATVEQDVGNSGDTNHRAASYGVICQNTTGQQPSPNFSGCQLVSAGR